MIILRLRFVMPETMLDNQLYACEAAYFGCRDKYGTGRPWRLLLKQRAEVGMDSGGAFLMVKIRGG